jgi:hypothetical protein
MTLKESTLERRISDLEIRISGDLPPPSMTWDRCYDFLNIFAEKFGEKFGVFTQNKAKVCKILIITLVFEKNANFFAENCRKSPKILIITSTPAANVIKYFFESHIHFCFGAINTKKCSRG